MKPTSAMRFASSGSGQHQEHAPGLWHRLLHLATPDEVPDPAGLHVDLPGGAHHALRRLDVDVETKQRIQGLRGVRHEGGARQITGA